MRWPIGIAFGLAIVVAVDLFFVMVATQNAPIVERSYIEAPR